MLPGKYGPVYSPTTNQRVCAASISGVYDVWFLSSYTVLRMVNQSETVRMLSVMKNKFVDDRRQEEC
jgi:hypothetical protein